MDGNNTHQSPGTFPRLKYDHGYTVQCAEGLVVIFYNTENVQQQEQGNAGVHQRPFNTCGPLGPGGLSGASVHHGPIASFYAVNEQGHLVPVQPPVNTFPQTVSGMTGLHHIQAQPQANFAGASFPMAQQQHQQGPGSAGFLQIPVTNGPLGTGCFSGLHAHHGPVLNYYVMNEHGHLIPIQAAVIPFPQAVSNMAVCQHIAVKPQANIAGESFLAQRQHQNQEDVGSNQPSFELHQCDGNTRLVQGSANSSDIQEGTSGNFAFTKVGEPKPQASMSQVALDVAKPQTADASTSFDNFLQEKSIDDDIEPRQRDEAIEFENTFGPA